jgi:hypothetical protein
MLLPTTLDVIRAALKSDPNPSPADRARLLALIRAGGAPQPKPAPMVATGPRILARREVASRLSKTLRFVDRLAQQGVLKKVRVRGRARSIGFLEADINNLIAGNQ